MTQATGESIAELLRVSLRDEWAMKADVDAAIFGFVAQQATEKLLKALIVAHNTRYKYTHDISTLIGDLETLQEDVPPVASHLDFLTDYAGKFRYQDVREIDEDGRRRLRDQIAELRVWVLARIEVLVPAEARMEGTVFGE